MTTFESTKPEDVTEDETAKEEYGLPEPKFYEFVLERKEVPIKLIDPKSKVAKWFAMKEMDGLLRDKYMDELLPRINMDFDSMKSRGFTKYEGLQAALISSSLFEADVDDKDPLNPVILRLGDPASVDFVQSLPSHVQDGLFDIAQKINGVDKKAKDLAKND